MADTSIQWTDKVWNVTRGCSRVSPGCGGARGVGGCYAERQAARFSGPGQPYEGLVEIGKQGPRWTGRMRFVAEKLTEPLHWRKDYRVFVDSMSDLFHDGVSDDEIDRVFAVMAICSMHIDRPSHTFQILTKRSARMHAYASAPLKELRERIGRVAGKMMEDGDSWADAVTFQMPWPLPNVWMGVSVETPEYMGRVDDLRVTPAAVRFLSLEPLLADLGVMDLAGIHMAIVGGESGPGARPMRVDWARSIVAQCRSAGVAPFIKQMGRRVLGDSSGFTVNRWILEDGSEWVPPIIGERAHHRPDNATGFVLFDSHGGDMTEWPPDLRVREFPRAQ